jgi:hypothetical protein
MTSAPTIKFNVVDRNMVMEWVRRTRYVFVGSELEVEYCADHAGACVLK